MEKKPDNPVIIVADSSGLISLGIKTDSNHPHALRAAEDHSKAGGVMVIPAEVFAETVNVLGRKFGHAFAAGTAAEFLTSGTAFLVETTSPEVRQTALDSFQRQAEGVSFTDCVVMAFADYYGTNEIFGFDDCFRKNGYQFPQPAEEPEAA